MRRFLLNPLLIATLAVAGANLAAPRAAHACPMCRTANESGETDGGTREANTRPKAYMYSILFMLAMPATLLAGFGFGFYRLAKRKAAEELASSVEGSHHIAGGEE